LVFLFISEHCRKKGPCPQRQQAGLRGGRALLPYFALCFIDFLVFVSKRQLNLFILYHKTGPMSRAFGCGGQ